MLKPNGYDETQVAGSWEAPEVGGHILTIKSVEERKTKTGKDMIVVLFDFAGSDRQPGLFMKSFEEDVRPDKKWPYSGTAYIMVNDYSDPSKTSRDFKKFVTAVEKSNNGFVTAWGDDWGAQFKGKHVGAVYGKVESEYNGARSMRSQLRWFCDVAAAPKANIPEPKLLQPAAVAPAAAEVMNEGFMQIPDNAEAIPF